MALAARLFESSHHIFTAFELKAIISLACNAICFIKFPVQFIAIDLSVELQLRSFRPAVSEISGGAVSIIAEGTELQNKALASMLANSADDDEFFDKWLETEKFGHGAPGTMTNLQSAANKWDNWYHNVRGNPQGPGAPVPTGQDIERFIVSVARNSKSSIKDKLAISLVTMENRLSRVIQYLQYTHKAEFKILPHEKTGIKACLDRLCKEGLLTRGVWVERRRFSFLLLETLISNLFTTAIVKGPLFSWDNVLLWALGIVLQSATAARGGDIVRSNGYTGNEYLAWKDVELKVKANGKSVQDITAVVTLRYCKGKKLLPSENRKVTLNPLKNDKHNIMCPIKLLLIMALRLGITAAKTPAELISRALGTRDRRIVWKHPDYPVICGSNRHHVVVPSMCIGPGTLSARLKSVAAKSGLVGLGLGTTANRRGAAREIAHAATTFKGTSDDAAAAALGHSASTKNAGLTREVYIGDSYDDFYSHRSENPQEDPHAPQLPTRKRARILESDKPCYQNFIYEDDMADSVSGETEPAVLDSDAIDPSLVAPEILKLSKALAPDPNVEIEELDQELVHRLNLTEIQYADESILHSTPDEFLSLFSRINVFTEAQSLKYEQDQMRQTSCDDGTMFQWFCGKCKVYSHSDESRVHYHMVNCSGPPGEPALCDVCGKPYRNEASLSAHKRAYHAWKPKRCPDCPESDCLSGPGRFEETSQEMSPSRHNSNSLPTMSGPEDMTG
ncbi:hypothetical protein ASPCAL08606 [Aspergillus calidoustus]|uniref:C2H2-type domain-containing protein n=1 Tax=Aspergillus calidoustus TaxID=454130 RepID=A0A0U5GTR7_ASPCI|nr:hypothetical protein ASPCAL08606 [Aspergillus calidoustus]